MNTTPTPSRRKCWDWTFIRLMPAVVVAAAIGLLFGNPVDNLIVIAWIPPLWILVRFLSPTMDSRIDVHESAPSV